MEEFFTKIDLLYLQEPFNFYDKKYLEKITGIRIKKPYWERYSCLSIEEKREYHKLKMQNYRKQKRLKNIYSLREKR